MKKAMATGLVAAVILAALGCEKTRDERIAELAERNSDRVTRQAEQMVELQQEVAEGSRRLVEADAEARKELVTLQREIQAERAEVDRQRDALEDERRNIAGQRHRDPLVAAAITSAGLMLACLLPLVICLFLLWRGGDREPDAELAALLISEIANEEPLLLPSPRSALEDQSDVENRRDDVSDPL